MATPLTLYRPGKVAGYDPKKRRYREASGRKISKAQFLGLQQDKDIGPDSDQERYGFSFNLNKTPFSDIMGKIERLIGGAEKGQDLSKDPLLLQAGKRYNELVGFVPPQDPKQTAQPIPTAIRAAMNLAEYYCNTEGDVFQHIEAPIDVCLSPLDIAGPAKKELEQLYSPENLDMGEILFQIMLSTGIYGSAYPVEVYNRKDPLKVILLPPKYMWVGYWLSFGEHLGIYPEGFDSPYALKPLDGSSAWTQDLLDAQLMPMTYNSFSTNWNEQILKGWGVPLNPEFLHPVRAKALSYNRYPLPPISRAFRSIATRSVFEEMRRATIEGYRNQLWVFLLGDVDHPPSPKEMAALQSSIAGMAGERTGYLAWRGGLKVEQHAPESIDGMLGNETSQMFSLEIFRMLGSNIRLVTGNQAATNARGDSSIEIDLTLWLRRLEFIRTQILKWELSFRLRWAQRQNDSKLENAVRKSQVTFSKSLLEVSQLIKSELQPLYMFGSLSTQTLLKKAGYNYEIELVNKQEEEANAALFGPKPTYAQETVNPSTPEKTVENAPQGRPADVVNPNQLQAMLDQRDAMGALRELILHLGHRLESLESNLIQPPTQAQPPSEFWFPLQDLLSKVDNRLNQVETHFMNSTRALEQRLISAESNFSQGQSTLVSQAIDTIRETRQALLRGGGENGIGDGRTILELRLLPSEQTPIQNLIQVAPALMPEVRVENLIAAPIVQNTINVPEQLAPQVQINVPQLSVENIISVPVVQNIVNIPELAMPRVENIVNLPAPNIQVDNQVMLPAEEVVEMEVTERDIQGRPKKMKRSSKRK